MTFMTLRRRTIETDLKGDARARQRAQRLQPLSGEQHAVGEHRGWRRRGTGEKDLADFRQHERLATGDKDFADAKLRRLGSNAPNPLQSQRTPRRRG